MPNLINVIQKYKFQSNDLNLNKLNINELVNSLKNEDFTQLIFNFKFLNTNDLWDETLITYFQTELLNRYYKGISFNISTSWHDINDWIKNPFVYIQLGTEDDYYIVNNNNQYIINDININVVYIDDDHDDSENILREILNNISNVIINLQVYDNNIHIIGINGYKIQELYNTEVINVTARIIEFDDHKIFRDMLNQLKEKIKDKND